MKLLYVNDLRGLPNFGCRSTGTALEDMLAVHHTVNRRDGLETVLHSGWDAYATGPLRLAGILPERGYALAWRQRYRHPFAYRMYAVLDRLLFARHDVVGQDVSKSVAMFLAHARTHPYCAALQADIETCDALVINGEGTLVLGRPPKRDALFLLFVMMLAHRLGKPVHLLNAMVTTCPYSGADAATVQSARAALDLCATLVCREATSQAFVRDLIMRDTVRVLPDALFRWGPQLRETAGFLKRVPALCLPFGAPTSGRALDFARPYICVSGSSSAWRFGGRAVTQMAGLVARLRATGCRVYLIETCAGDAYLSKVGRLTGETVIPVTTPVLAGGGLLAGAAVYVSGRYHPAIMAAAGGVPTVFLSSNSHKTTSVQHLLDYDTPQEFPICPTDEDIGAIGRLVEHYLQSRATLSARISAAFQRCADAAGAYVDLLG